MTRILAGTSIWRGASRPGDGALYSLTTAEGSWARVTDPPIDGVQAIAADPRTGTILAGTSDGVYRSSDGARWDRCGSGSEGQAIWSILLHPARPGTIFAGVGPRGILRSTDHGATWSATTLDASAQIFNIADDGVTLLPFSARVTGLAADETDPDILYAAVEVEGVLRSIDGGQTWHDSSHGLLALADASHLAAKIGQMDGRKSMADGHAILTHGNNIFYANRLGLFRSEDRAETWQDVRLDQVSPLTYVRCIVAAPADPDTFYAALSVRSGGDDSSVWQSRDAGRTWRRFDRDIAPDSTIMAVAAHPTDPRIVFATSYSGQLFGTEDGGQTWRTWNGPTGATESYALACLHTAREKAG